jgi:glycosyltransferase involved in cell wall biosynthesis
MRISFLIPCHNEEELVETTYKKVKKVCDGHGLEYEIILEQDGSTDRTSEIIDEIAKSDKRVISLNFPEKMGKGSGLLRAFEASKGDIIVFLDADIPFDLNYVGKLLERFDESDVVIASRYAGERKDIPISRVTVSRIYNLINRVLFGIKIRDTQSSMQLFKREVLEKVGSWSPGFEYNIEVLVKAQRSGFKITEAGVPYVHRDRGEFSVSKYGFKMVANTIKMAFKIS